MPETRRQKILIKKLGLVENCCYFSTYWIFKKNDLTSKNHCYSFVCHHSDQVFSASALRS